MRTTYQCEKCERVYRNRGIAIACEESPLAPPKFKVGDKVKVKNYEREFEQVTIVKEPKIHSDYVWGWAQELEEDDEGLERFAKILEGHADPHYWVYEVSEYVKISDGNGDNDYDKYISESALTLVSE